MRLLVIRHALAGDAEKFARTGVSDDLRPITARGRERMQRGAIGLRRLVPSIDLLATSPLVRARQTAEIVAAAYGVSDIPEVEALRPGGEQSALLEWLGARENGEVVAIVGHRPDLDELVGLLVTGQSKPIINLKKGGVLMLELDPAGDPRPGEATLLWAMKPSHLRRIGR